MSSASRPIAAKRAHRRRILFPRPLHMYIYARFTYYMSYPPVSCLQSATAPRSRKRYDIWSFVGRGVRKDERRRRWRREREALLLPAFEIAPEGKSFCIMQSDIYRGACQRIERRGRALCLRRARLAKAHETFSPVNRDDREGGRRRSTKWNSRRRRRRRKQKERLLVLMENRSRCACSVVDGASFRSRSPDAA